MSKNGHIEPIHRFQELITLLYKHVSIRMFHTCFTKIYNQSHMLAFFSKAASSECRLPEYSLYMEGGSHDGVSNVQ